MPFGPRDRPTRPLAGIPRIGHQRRVRGDVSRSIAARLRDHPSRVTSVRIVVSGDVGDRDAWEAAVRRQVAIALPDLPPRAIRIVHGPGAWVCRGCRTSFVTPEADVACPFCGGPPEPLRLAERIEIEWGDDRGSKKSTA